MPITRRDAAKLGLLTLPVASRASYVLPRWTRAWDQAVLSVALTKYDEQFDAKESMLVRPLGAEYHYHTELRSRPAHPTRESLEYALLLLESGRDSRKARAQAILDRCLRLQDVDPQSRWYGLWGYYLEEPASAMAPADFNWADFNGSLLLLMEARHGRTLPVELRGRVREAIRMAAASVRRRNVTMTYTNIAVQGSFVTLAAAELLVDPDLLAYAKDRLRRFAAEVDRTGSFAEYNSPTYGNVTIANLTRIRMFCRDAEALARVEKLHERAWLHMAKHWHLPTRQFAGPMSRCYATDLAAPLWIQKALDGRIDFATLEDIRHGRAGTGGETAILDYRCPSSVEKLFLDPKLPQQHRELFIPGKEPVRPVQGTTWMTPRLALGSANRSDFWVQRRPLVGCWGTPRSGKYIQLRLLRDDYDFASGLLYSVQERGFLLALATFRSPGGDKHVSLDPIAGGQFSCKRLRLRMDIAGLDAERILVDGKSAQPGSTFPAGARVALDLGLASLVVDFRTKLPVTIDHEEDRLTISQDFHRSDEPAVIRWSEWKHSYAAMLLAMSGPERRLQQLDDDVLQSRFEDKLDSPGVRRLFWRTPIADLGLRASAEVRPVEDQDARFLDEINSRPVPLERLSTALLA